MLKNILKKYLPKHIYSFIIKLYVNLFVYPINYFKRINVEKRKVKKHLIKNPKIRNGVFKNMTYWNNDFEYQPLFLTILGYYELAIHKFIQQALDKNYLKFIDIGCGGGYYIVGLAKFSKIKEIIGYEITEKARILSRKISILNNVEDKIKIKSRCDHISLSNEIVKNTLIMCDCEGFENEILDPNKIPRLLECDILLELHPFYSDKNLNKIIMDRFKKTHTIKKTRLKKEYNLDEVKSYIPEEILNMKLKYFKDLMLKERGQNQDFWYLVRK